LFDDIEAPELAALLLLGGKPAHVGRVSSLLGGMSQHTEWGALDGAENRAQPFGDRDVVGKLGGLDGAGDRFVGVIDGLAKLVGCVVPGALTLESSPESMASIGSSL
jgi:hypothetical protein